MKNLHQTLTPFTHTFLGLIAGLLMLSQCVHATPPLLPENGDSGYFYEIGAGSNYHSLEGIEFPNELAMKLNYAMMFSNGKFDPIFSIKQTLNNIKNTAKSKLMTITSGITSSVTALPGYIFCRANPLGCQLNENYTARAEEKNRETVRYFQDMEKQLADIRPNLEGYLQAGRAQKLIEASSGGNKDIEIALSKVKEYTGAQGIKWIGGSLAGGDGQPPIRPVADTVVAGYNMMLKRDPTNQTRATGDNPLIDHWDTPEEAAKWVTEVVGEYRPDINNSRFQALSIAERKGSDDGDHGTGGEDTIVGVAFTSQDVSTPALGLQPKVNREANAIENKLNALLIKKNPSKEELTQMMGKSTNVLITPELLTIIKHQPPEIRQALVRQFSQNAALTNMTRTALTARRMLRAGRHEPHIAAYKPTTDDIERRVDALDKEIETLVFEHEINAKIMNQSLSTILKLDERRSGDALRGTRGTSGMSLKGGARKQ